MFNICVNLLIYFLRHNFFYSSKQKDRVLHLVLYVHLVSKRIMMTNSRREHPKAFVCGCVTVPVPVQSQQLQGDNIGIAAKAVTDFSNFYVLLTVHCSIFILVINQLDAQNLFYKSLFRASTCFEHICSSSGGQNCITQPLVSSHL